MALGRYVLTADVTVPAGTSSYPASGPATTSSASTTATPASDASITSQSLTPGTWLIGWTGSLQTAAASQDANNFQLYNLTATSVIATSVNAGTVGTYPQQAVSTYLGVTSTVQVQVGASAGSTGSVYHASLTVTPLTSGDNKGAVAWTGPGSPPGWSAGPFPVTFLEGTPLWLDSAGTLYATIGSGQLRAWIDGTDSAGGHGHWGLSN